MSERRALASHRTNGGKRNLPRALRASPPSGFFDRNMIVNPWTVTPPTFSIQASHQQHSTSYSSMSRPCITSAPLPAGAAAAVVAAAAAAGADAGAGYSTGGVQGAGVTVLGGERGAGGLLHGHPAVSLGSGQSRVAAPTRRRKSSCEQEYIETPGCRRPGRRS
jgi:hypothetical protein